MASKPIASKASQYLSIYSDKVKEAAGKIPGIKWVEPHGNNLWTGLKITKSAGALFTGAIAVGAIGAAAVEAVTSKEKMKRNAAISNSQNVGPVAGTSYESTGARGNLGASGDLVLGLNNMRRG